MKKLTTLIALLFVCSSGYLWAQTQGTAYTAVGKGVATTFLTDYQCLGINSSALGWGTGYKDKHFTLGTTEFYGSIASPSLNKTRLKNAYRSIRDQISGKNEGFDYKKQLNAAGDYAESGIDIAAKFNWLGVSYQSEKFGGIAFSITENYHWYSQFNKNTSGIVFRGQYANVFDSLTVAMNGDTSNIANSSGISSDTLNAVIGGKINHPILLSKLTQGTRIKFLWNRQYSIGYGRKIFGNPEKFALYGGVGARFIQSVAYFNVQSDESGLHGTSAVSPYFGINFKGNQGNSSKGFFPKSIGNGYGLDFSASVKLFGHIKIAAAVNNIGSVTYNRKVYSVKDTLISSVRFPGVKNGDVRQAMDQLSSNGNFLNYEGKQKIVIQNPANFRFGGSISFFKKKINVGIDVVAPFHKDTPGSLQNAVVSVGGDFRPFKFLQLSIGYYGGGIYKSNIPVGINFILGGGTYELGIASRDIISFVSKGGHSLSMAFGFARIRF